MIAIILMVALVGGFVLYQRGFDLGLQETGEGGGWSLPFNIKIPDFNIIINTPEGDTTPPPSDPSDPAPPPLDNFRIPSELTIFLNPTTIDAGDGVLGELVSNGYNSEVRIFVKHLGTGEVVDFETWLGADGKFSHAQLMEVAGRWEFWATANEGAVESNHAILVVRGFQIVQSGHYSGSLSPPYPVQIFSHLSGHADLYAIDHGAGVWTPLSPRITVNTGGFGQEDLDLSMLGAGDYEFESILGGVTASSWGGTSWVTVGR